MKFSRGFTLIELLVVIAIIGILSSVVLASLSTARTKANDAARISDVGSLKTAMEMYAATYGGYPTSAGSPNGDVYLSDPTLVSKLVPTYIASMPAILVADGDHYYGNGVTSGVTGNYDMLIYVGATNNYCRTGTVPQNQGDWNIMLMCNF